MPALRPLGLPGSFTCNVYTITLCTWENYNVPSFHKLAQSSDTTLIVVSSEKIHEATAYLKSYVIKKISEANAYLKSYVIKEDKWSKRLP